MASKGTLAVVMMQPGLSISRLAHWVKSGNGSNDSSNNGNDTNASDYS